MAIIVISQHLGQLIGRNVYMNLQLPFYYYGIVNRILELCKNNNRCGVIALK